jgi:hypothetical protein
MLFVPAAVLSGNSADRDRSGRRYLRIRRAGLAQARIAAACGRAAIGAALALYLIFELTFQISLPRGALGTLFGF